MFFFLQTYTDAAKFIWQRCVPDFVTKHMNILHNNIVDVLNNLTGIFKIQMKFFIWFWTH